MNQYGLDIHSEVLLAEYHSQQALYNKLLEVVRKTFTGVIQQSGIELNSVECRIKTEASLAGKLKRKGYKYAALTDITDIVGARFITFFNEDVDRIASMAEQLYDIDWQNSVDKRKQHSFNSFGYNSLHYICRVPKSLFYDENFPELNNIRFELQMRTALQHVWSAIQHDIGYKTEIDIPVEYQRSLSRMAGLLELADNEFSRIRNDITEYRRRMQNLMQRGRLEEVALDGDTFNSYLKQRPFDRLNRKIASITQAELQETNFHPYLRVLRQLGMKTLGDVERMIEENSADAYQLALFQLGSTDIDILSETIGLQNLCIVTILKQGGGKPGIKQLFDDINRPSPQNDMLAAMVTEQASRLSFMNK